MLRRSFWVLGLAVLVAGCGRIPFLARPYDNFTAYYNTFYNARQAFDAGLEGIERENQPVDADQYMDVFTSPGRSSGGRDFDAAIRKSADVLRDHPDSKWADDALLLIGKSYFYLQNYVGAEQKFREVISAGSGLEDEARFWLARALIASNRYTEAEEHLELSLAREGLARRWESMLRLALGELYVESEDWGRAAEQLALALGDVPERDLGARAQYLLGQVYETLGRYEAAVDAYNDVGRFKPLYELAYAAQYASVRVQGLHIEPDVALRRLRRMERDDNNYENRAELAYLRGRVYQAAGQPEDALQTYDELLYESDANIADVRGRVHYALGELFRDSFGDYLFAAAHFDTAATSLRSGAAAQGGGGAGSVARTPVTTPYAIIDAGDQAEVFSSFAQTAGDVARMDSLLYLGTLDQEAFDAFVLELREQRAREIADQQREQERRQAEQGFQSLGGTPGGVAAGGTNAATAGGESGFLFHRDPARVEQNYQMFVDTWGERPLVPNWRRLEAVNAAIAESRDEATGVGAQPARPAALTEASLPRVDVSAVPRDSAGQATMRRERAMARYELGNVLFIAMGRPDSAATWYRLVVEEDGEEEVAQRATYALAEVQRALGDTLASEQLYRYVAEKYPSSEFARRIRGTAGSTQAADTLHLAEEAYGRAYRTWQRGAYRSALDSLVLVAAAYPATPVAPRALLAAGRAYMEWAQRDSLDLFDPLPLSVDPEVLVQAGVEVEAEPVADTTAASPPAAASLAEPPAEAVPLAPTDVPQKAPREEAASAEPVRPDTVATAAEDVAEDVAVPADTTDIALADTTVAQPTPADSTAAAPQRAPQPAANTPRRPAVTLPILYASIEKTYPQSEQAQMARALTEALSERRALLDSLAAASRPEVAALDTTAADTTVGVGVPAPADSLGTPSRPPEAADPRAAAAPENAGATDDARGSVPDASRPVAGGAVPPWVIVAGSGRSTAAAQTDAATMQEQLGASGYPVAVYATTDASGAALYRIGIGAFDDRAAAERAQASVRALLSPDVWLWSPAEHRAGRVPAAAQAADEPSPVGPSDDAETAGADAEAAKPETPAAAPDSAEAKRAALQARAARLLAQAQRPGDASAEPAPASWLIVLGSTSEAAAADSLATVYRERLRDREVDVGVYPATSPEGALWVGAGPYPSDAAARQARQALSGLVPPGAPLVPLPGAGGTRE